MHQYYACNGGDSGDEHKWDAFFKIQMEYDYGNPF